MYKWSHLSPSPSPARVGGGGRAPGKKTNDDTPKNNFHKRRPAHFAPLYHPHNERKRPSARAIKLQIKVRLCIELEPPLSANYLPRVISRNFLSAPAASPNRKGSRASPVSALQRNGNGKKKRTSVHWRRSLRPRLNKTLKGNEIRWLPFPRKVEDRHAYRSRWLIGIGYVAGQRRPKTTTEYLGVRRPRGKKNDRSCIPQRNQWLPLGHLRIKRGIA